LKVIELIEELEKHIHHNSVYFRIGSVSYPIIYVSEEIISEDQTLIILSNEQKEKR